MMNVRARSCAAFVALLCVSGVSRLPATEDKPGVPADLKIIATYEAGYRGTSSWQCTITANGTVARKLTGSDAEDPKNQGNLKLTPADLQALHATITKADFSALKERYDYNESDHPTYTLDITLNDKTHKVSVYAPDHWRKDEEGKRFLKVWSEVLRKVPPPNPNQKPDMDKP